MIDSMFPLIFGDSWQSSNRWVFVLGLYIHIRAHIWRLAVWYITHLYVIYSFTHGKIIQIFTKRWYNVLIWKCLYCMQNGVQTQDNIAHNHKSMIVSKSWNYTKIWRVAASSITSVVNFVGNNIQNNFVSVWKIIYRANCICNRR